MLLTNARVYTLDARASMADTVVVRNGMIAYVGRRGDVNPDIGEAVVDLGGRTLLPGFVDSHAHLIGLARGVMSLNVSGGTSAAEIAARVADAARVLPLGAWITGRGWDETRWRPAVLPTAALLDAVAPHHPVCLTRIDGHAAWVNTAALHAGGISRDSADPPGGRILRDEHGEPTGVLIDRAQELVSAVIPQPGEAETDAAVTRAIAACLRVGLVGVHEMGVGLETLASYRRLIARNAFPFRVYAAVMGRSRTAWAAYRERGPVIDPTGRLTVRAVKYLADGALGSRGAAMEEPYADEPDNRGLLLMEADEIEHVTREAVAAGFQPCIHAIGDRANAAVLDAYERVLAERPGHDLRLRVEHAQILRPADIPRFRRLNVLPSMQPTHCTSDMPWAEARIGAARLPGAYAWRSLLDTGVIIPGGSDFPVEEPNPLHGIHAAVTRRARDGSGRQRQPEQRMTRLEAVRAFTTWAAYAAFEERVAGSIESGKRADLVVLDDDPFTCDETVIAAIPVAMTIVAGEIAYRAEG